MVIGIAVEGRIGNHNGGITLVPERLVVGKIYARHTSRSAATPLALSSAPGVSATVS